MKIPLVSVLLPYRNAENTLLRCLNSLKNQLLHNELILVENQPEESPVVIEFILQNPHLNILKIKELRPGIVHALNAGLQHCRGLFIARMDADDEMLENRLTLQSNYLIQNPDIDLVSGLVEYTGDQQKNFGFFLYVQQINSIKSVEEISALRFIESPFAHPSVMFRKSAIDQPNLYKHGDFPEDYDLWLRWLQMGRKMAKIDSPVLRWHDSNSRLSRVDQRCSLEAFRQLKTEYLIRWINNNVSKEKKIIIAGAGKLAKPTINQLIENQIPISAITDLKERNFLNIPFIPWKELPEPLEYFIISLVSNRGSWQIIRKDLENRGYEMMRDFILCA
jgi:glycosyltransferase involved in cell wall biosynthesis